MIGYKKALENKLVVLEIPDDALTNLHRGNIAKRQFAKYRCSKAFVKEIIDLTTNESVQRAHSIHNYKFIYRVGKIVVPEKQYNEYPEAVCSSGIHFFIDREIAEQYNYEPTYGEVKKYHENGHLMQHYFAKDGKLHGDYRVYAENGHLSVEENYVNGEREGESKSYCRDTGKLLEKRIYKNGKLEGEYQVWSSVNGQQLNKEFYKNGKLHGESLSWFGNGILRSKEIFENGKREGESLLWYNTGQMASQKFFKNDMLVGKEKHWDMEGRLIQEWNWDNK